MKKSLEPVRFSHLKRISESPLHYAHGLTEEQDKAAYQFGRLTHYLTLGAGLGGTAPSFVIWEEVDDEGKPKARRGKTWDAFKAQHKDREIFTLKDFEAATLIANAVKSDPIAGPLLVGGIAERLVNWELAGRKCRSHVDKHNPERKLLIDLKTTTCSAIDKFPWEAKRFGYIEQMSWYQDALAFIGEPVEKVILIAVEKTAPYAVTCFEVMEDDLLQGRKTCRLWFERLMTCEKTNAWPPYAQGIVPLKLPVAASREPLVLTMADGSEMIVGEAAA